MRICRVLLLSSHAVEPTGPGCTCCGFPWGHGNKMVTVQLAVRELTRCRVFVPAQQVGQWPRAALTWQQRSWMTNGPATLIHHIAVPSGGWASGLRHGGRPRSCRAAPQTRPRKLSPPHLSTSLSPVRHPSPLTWAGACETVQLPALPRPTLAHTHVTPGPTLHHTRCMNVFNFGNCKAQNTCVPAQVAMHVCSMCSTEPFFRLDGSTSLLERNEAHRV